MEEEYPDESDLQKIREWDAIKDPFGLVEFIKLICNYDAICWTGKKVWQVEFHTCGWSGNEDIINALHDNKHLFWGIYWQKSERGGHYYFKIRKLK
jgi:hypothetical protein